MLMNKTGITAIKMTQMAVVMGRYASSSCSSLSPPGDTWNCPLKSYSPVAMATVLSMALAGVENAVRYKENKWGGNYVALFAQLLVAWNTTG